MVDVVGAFIYNNKNEIMICQRPINKKRALLWEFPGGKVEKGETKIEALIRECKEELDVTLDVEEEIFKVHHKYPDIDITLTLFKSKIASGEVKMIEHNDIKWIKKTEFNSYQFCPADKDIIDAINRGEL